MVAPGLAHAAVVTEFTGGVTNPGAMAAGSDGNVWFINGSGIAKIDPSGHVTAYTAGLEPGATPYDLTSGPNGDLWFTDNGAKAVGYITPSGAIHEFPAPAGDVPLQVVAGSDGNIWFYSVDGATHSIVKMTPGGTFTGYPFMSSLSEIADNMVLGPDGDIWFADMGTTSIGKIAPNGTITEYPLAMGAIPTNITVGPDGNLWFSDNSGAIGRITTSGSVHEFTSGLQSGAVPDAISAGTRRQRLVHRPVRQSACDRTGHPVGPNHRVHSRSERRPPARHHRRRRRQPVGPAGVDEPNDAVGGRGDHALGSDHRDH